MQYPELRMRRLRATKKLRDMVRETSLSVNDFIYPLFVKEGIHAPEEIRSMPDQYQYPPKDIVEAAREAQALGIPAVMMFGIPELKDEVATSALDENGLTQNAMRAIKEA
ncbi:porphobilinogen synthase, partial [Candidatus Bathyarchaeota archaeon]|nr:porphobilinogen synthase [Candidatus Bathyarchaeota archaeon]